MEFNYDSNLPMTAEQKEACGHIEKMFGAWGSGKFHSSQGYEAWSKNCGEFFDETCVMNNTGYYAPQFKVYSGMKEMFTWQSFFDSFGWLNMKVTVFPGAQGTGDVVMSIQADMQFPGPDMTAEMKPVAGTGGKILEGVNNVFVWTYNYDTKKTSALNAYFDKAQEAKAMFGEFKLDAAQTTSAAEPKAVTETAGIKKKGGLCGCMGKA